MKKMIMACFIFALSGTTAWADPLTLTFDETPPGLVSVTNPGAPAGTSPFLSFRGVSFDFRVGNQLSADARYGATGPGNFTFIQGRVLEGDAAGILTLNFGVPTPLLAFGVGLTSQGGLTPGFTVELFNGVQSLGSVAVSTGQVAGLPLSVGQFSFSGPLISRAVINFNEAALSSPRRFALDNLTYEPVPEPATLILLGTGLAGIAASVRRRRHQADKGGKV